MKGQYIDQLTVPEETAFITLTYWGWDKMYAVSQTMFLNAFSWMKMYNFD